MANTNELREQNASQIRQVLSSGREYSPSEMSEATGLCRATCNTILRKLQAEGIAIEEERQTNVRGRKTTFFRMNPDCEKHLFLFDNEKGGMELVVLFNFGGMGIHELYETMPTDTETIQAILDECFSKTSGIRKVVLAVSECAGGAGKQEPRLPDGVEFLKLSERDCVAAGLRKRDLVTVLRADHNGMTMYHCCGGRVVGVGSTTGEQIPEMLIRLQRLTGSHEIIVTGNALSAETVEQWRDPELPALRYEETLMQYRIVGAHRLV